MEHVNHPELDLSEELDKDGVKLYQSLIWACAVANYNGKI